MSSLDPAGLGEEDTCSFDEFKLYYESTEKVTDRRLNANRWNYSISVGILLAIAAMYSWGITNRAYFLLTGVGILVLSGAAAVFCLFWLRQVEDWKALNAAKFQVLNDMARRVRFESPQAGTSSARSYEPFEKEWSILQTQRSLARVRIFKIGQIEALNASGAELFMPRAFIAIFSTVFATVALVSVLSWSALPREFTPAPSLQENSSTVATGNP